MFLLNGICYKKKKTRQAIKDKNLKNSPAKV